MDTKQFYQQVREVRESIPGSQVVVVSLATPDGGRPGYLGHRETQAILNQARLNAVASEYSDLSILLFDEVEKAAPALTRLLLGILDRAQARLGDNTMVNFERCLIFLTSNLGARQMRRALGDPFGMAPHEIPNGKELERIATCAAKRYFYPEFLNRIDRIFVYQPLTADMLDKILDIELAAVSERIRMRLDERSFTLDVGEPMRRHLIETGTSPEYGARELKRVLQRDVLEPVAHAMCRGLIYPGSRVSFSLRGSAWELVIEKPENGLSACAV